MKLIFVLAAALLVFTSLPAQQKRDTVHRTTTVKKTKMKDELGLNKKQEADVKASKKEYKAEKEKVKADTKLSATEKDAKMKQLKADKKKKIDATLTAEQKAKKKMLKAEKKAKKKKAKATS